MDSNRNAPVKDQTYNIRPGHARSVEGKQDLDQHAIFVTESCSQCVIQPWQIVAGGRSARSVHADATRPQLWLVPPTRQRKQRYRHGSECK